LHRFLFAAAQDVALVLNNFSNPNPNLELLKIVESTAQHGLTMLPKGLPIFLHPHSDFLFFLFLYPFKA